MKPVVDRRNRRYRRSARSIALLLFSRCKQILKTRLSFRANVLFQRVLFSYIIYFFVVYARVLLTLDYYTINFMKQSSRDVTPNLHRNWVIACFGSHVNLYLFSLINEDMWTVRTVQRSYDGLFRTEAEGSYPDFLPNF